VGEDEAEAMIIRFSGPVLRYVDFKREIQVDARTLREALTLVVRENPSLEPVIYDKRGQVRGVHRFFAGEDQLGSKDLDREFKPDECIDVVTAVAGGSECGR
jgi:hypothetical protein